MISKFVTVYPGHIDLPDMGQDATPANERRYSNAELASVFDKTEKIARSLDDCGFDTLWIAERADVTIEFGKPQLPNFPLPDGFASDTEFLRRSTDRMIKMTVPGPFTMTQQAFDDYYKDEAALSLDYADAVNAEIKDLFAAGADIVQIDEPYMQARPEKAREYGLEALNAALDGVTGKTAVHICFGYAALIHTRPSGYSFLPEFAGCRCAQDASCSGAARPGWRRVGGDARRGR